MKLFSFRNLRILILLLILATAAIYTQGQRLQSTAWITPLEVILFPINGDGRAVTRDYIHGLNDRDFSAIDEFMAREGKKYQVMMRHPTHTRLGPEVSTHPPSPPSPGENPLLSLLWSLRLRYWAWRNTPDGLSNRDRVRVYVLYHQGEEGKALQHSLGMQKGLLGVVHAYADPAQNAQNNLVIAHEVLHTLGALDKYDSRGHPVYPDGFANPDRQPRYPQVRAEIMAGRVPLSATESHMAFSLRSTVVGKTTAREINWIQ